MRATPTITTNTTGHFQSRLAVFFARPYGRAVLVYTLGALLALLPVSGDGWSTALRRLLLVGVSVAIFFAIALLANRVGRLRWLVALIVAVTVVIAVMGTAQVNTVNLRLTGLNYQVYSTLHRILPLDGLPTVNQNVLGGLLVTFLPLAVAIAIWEKPWWFRLYGLGSALVIVGGIFVTASRSAQLGLAALVFVFCFLLTAGHLRLRLALGFLVVLALVGGIVYLSINGLSGIESGVSRTEVWRTTLAMIADYPLTGAGLGQYPAHFLEYATPFLAGNAQPHAHNIFLQSLVEFGLAGFICIILMLWTTLRLFISYHNLNIIDAPLRPVVGGAMAGMTVYFVSGMLEYGNWGGKFAPAFWVLPALLAAALPELPPLTFIKKISRSRSGAKRFNRRVRLALVFLAATLVVFLFGPLGLINVATILRPAQASQSLYQLAAVSSFWNATPLRDQGKLALARNDPANAELYFKQALQRDPNDWLSLLPLADLSEKAGNPTQAVAYRRRAMAGPDFMLLANQELARNPPNHPAAEAYLRLVLEINPGNTEATSALIKSYIESGNKQEALAFLQKATSLSDNDANLYWEWGNTYRKQNQTETAEEIFKRILELNPHFQPAIPSLAGIS